MALRVSCGQDRKSTRLNSSHLGISYAVFCLKKKKNSRFARRSSVANISWKRARRTHIPINAFFISIVINCYFSLPISRDKLALFFFFNDTATTEIYTLSLHDALPIGARYAGLLAVRILAASDPRLRE